MKMFRFTKNTNSFRHFSTFQTDCNSMRRRSYGEKIVELEMIERRGANPQLYTNIRKWLVFDAINNFLPPDRRYGCYYKPIKLLYD